ncbi:hypothetical protein SARC_04604 [Sphaeroforma arctica JP610]|uniref:Fe2OG dioxygenase domain-containing protein n=1 Tax=Sphaeroforma arctica JP610 TaxID=667725 RepID=A0A0L0G1X6_9EUKA|nr:hypothetical protein SARC_04604 [Sphaeroforma arctica JP610]KNC83132.1 hypothetical protein SARC_04604 [Sphaeroforma arctica JP610]|eukprot:XP_014157034.1 hypothetical protein SARC_04604 [Sphaeroforma arctica JP610]
MDTVFEECLEALDNLDVSLYDVHSTSHTSETPLETVDASRSQHGREVNIGNTQVTAEIVEGVEGAFIIRNVLSKEECAPLRKAVMDLHASYLLKSKPRRSSQHHLPARVAQKALRGLCARIRHVLPLLAGPTHKGALECEGEEISNFLRCYHYKKNDSSAPHYDRSFTQHAELKGPEHGRLLRFSAYSMLLYLNDGFEGGNTTFFEKVDPALIAGTGFTLADESTRDQLMIAGHVAPQEGDVLIFPHGNHKGCHSNPFHEGSRLLKGEKIIIRTDIVYRAPPAKKKYKYQNVNI